MSEVGGQARERADRNWLILEYPGNPAIRLDARILDRILANDDKLALESYGISVVFKVASGPDAARSIAESLVVYTRSASITTAEGYEDAKRRIAAAQHGAPEWEPEALFFGDELVWSRDGILYVGQFACRLSDVERYATLGGGLPLPNGVIHAALPLLVVADKFRKEDMAELARRIEEYEARTQPLNVSGS